MTLPGRRWRSLLVVAVGAVLALGLWPAARRRAGATPARVVVLAFDGLDPRAIDLLLSEGKLPAFARLRREGSHGRLQSEAPLLGPVTWTTVATGKAPLEHGVGPFELDPATGEPPPVTSAMRKAKALWNIFSDRGRTVGVVGWWGTWPAEPVQGAIVSDRTCSRFLRPDTAGEAQDEAGLTHPAALAARIAPLVRRPADVTAEEAARFVQVRADELARPFAADDDLSQLRWALAAGDSYRRIGLDLLAKDRPDLLMVYTEGTESVSRRFGHLFRAPGDGGGAADERRRYGSAVEQMYVYADALVGEYLQALDAEASLVVLSDHGFDLGPAVDATATSRDRRRVSDALHNEYGVLYMSGPGVKRGVRLDGVTLLDVAPTVLALGGLPAARDMPGRALAEALARSVPAPRVATYEGGGASRTAGAEPADEAVLTRLRNLGYVGDSPARGGDSDARRTAGLHFEAHRYAEAAAIYERLLRQAPEDATLHASLAGALGAMGRYDESLAHLERAIDIEPVNAPAYHNAGVILERQGKTREAIERYRTAVRYVPGFKPSGNALLRLVGSAEVDVPRSPEERRAHDLAERAAAAAREGNYAGARTWLDEAEKIAPRYALVQQYRSNVAYLRGDVPAAIAALRRGLELEPDNLLFRRNLERLERRSAPVPPGARSR